MRMRRAALLFLVTITMGAVGFARAYNVILDWCDRQKYT